MLLLLISPLLAAAATLAPNQDDRYLYPQFPGVAGPLQTGEKVFLLWLVAGSGAPVEVAEGVIFLAGRT